MRRYLGMHKLVLGIYTFILLLPIVSTLVYSLTESWINLAPSGFPNLFYWKELLFDTPEFWESMGRSIVISIFPVIISTCVLIMAMYVSILYCPKLDAVIQTISMIPYTVRGVVLSISVLTLYAGKGLIISNRIVMLGCIYCVMMLPFLYRTLRNNLYAINVRQLLEAAELLGSSGLNAFFRVVVPNMLSGIVVCALVGMGSIFTDYAVIKIIVGTRYATAQHVLYNAQRAWMGPKTSALVIVMFAFMLTISAIAYGVQTRAALKREKATKGGK